MNASAISFLLFLGSLALIFWKPQAAAATALRMLIWAGLGFLSVIALLFSLFTVWWPPAQVWSVIWSGAAVLFLVVIFVSQTRPTDWLN